MAERQGFFWGQVYVVLAIVLGVVNVIYGSVGLSQGEGDTSLQVLAIVFGALEALSGIGIWGRRKWGLYLTYFVLLVHIAGVVINYIVYWKLLSEAARPAPAWVMIWGGVVAAILVVIFFLYIGYFFRRRHRFGRA